jgi:hypothetical protein
MKRIWKLFQQEGWIEYITMHQIQERRPSSERCGVTWDIACGIGGTAGYESAELHSTHIYTCWKEASTNIWRTAKWLKWFHSFIHFVIQTANTVWHRGAIENVSDFISAPFPRLLNLDILHYLSKHIKQNKKLRLVPDKSKIILAKCPQSGQMAEQNTKIHQGVRF